MFGYSFTGAHGRNLPAAILAETVYQPDVISGCFGGGDRAVGLAGHLHLFNSRETVPGPVAGMKTVIDSCPCEAQILLTLPNGADVPIPLRDGSYPGLTEMVSSFTWEKRGR